MIIIIQNLLYIIYTYTENKLAFQRVLVCFFGFYSKKKNLHMSPITKHVHTRRLKSAETRKSDIIFLFYFFFLTKFQILYNYLLTLYYGLFL
jgi:hypothetical protein